MIYTLKGVVFKHVIKQWEGENAYLVSSVLVLQVILVQVKIWYYSLLCVKKSVCGMRSGVSRYCSLVYLPTFD